MVVAADTGDDDNDDLREFANKSEVHAEVMAYDKAKREEKLAKLKQEGRSAGGASDDEDDAAAKRELRRVHGEDVSSNVVRACRASVARPCCGAHAGDRCGRHRKTMTARSSRLSTCRRSARTATSPSPATSCGGKPRPRTQMRG